MIAANEATCIYVLPRVFSEYKKQFPNVQILVDRSYGSRVVEAVLDNLADFGITQLPVTEKRLQIVKIHPTKSKLLMPANHPLAGRQSVTALGTGRDSLCCCRRPARPEPRLNAWLEPVEDEINVFHGAGFHRNDQALRAGGPGTQLPGRDALPGGSGGRAPGRRFAGTRSHGAAACTNL